MIEKLTPAGAVRAYCQDCLGMKQFNTDLVRDCQGDLDPNGPCAFFPYRLGKRPSVKVFRKFCLDCMIGDREAVACCELRIASAIRIALERTLLCSGNGKHRKRG